jgi:hypothetical protein
VDILADGGNALFQAGAWSRTIPEIAVFDGTFVAENVHSGDVVEIDHKRNLYRVIIGRAGIALAQEEERLARESRDKQSDARNAERVVEVFVPQGMELDDFLGFLPIRTSTGRSPLRSRPPPPPARPARLRHAPR